MASTVNSVPAANSASGNAVNPQNPGTRPSLRSSASTKASEGGRRQSGSPLESGQRYVVRSTCYPSFLPAPFNSFASIALSSPLVASRKDGRLLCYHPPPSKPCSGRVVSCQCPPWLSGLLDDCLASLCPRSLIFLTPCSCSTTRLVPDERALSSSHTIC